MGPDSVVYPPETTAYRMMGVLWDSKGDVNTWFGSDLCQVHGAQVLPMTPLTEKYLQPSFVQHQYPVFNELQCSGTDWEAYKIMEHAILDRDAAWERALSQESFHTGNSKSNMLFWIATRPSPQDVAA